jgi:twitching motility protein PilT
VDKITSWLDLAQEKKASDLHLIVASAPLLRIDGELQVMDGVPNLTAEDITQLFAKVTTPDQQKTFDQQKELDFALSLPNGIRLRCNACLQQGSISLNFRLLASEAPSIDDLELPQVCKELVLKQRGLIIVSGPTGSGKTTTLAAMIRHLNNVERRYVITIEDPIEYIHPSIKCAISQRELGDDTLSFSEALKYVLRQDPNVILVGEMRDAETAAAVIRIAETGHLVLSTGHAVSATQCVDRIVNLFPLDEQHSAQERLASVMFGILCQVLIPRVDSGRIAAVEIMLNTPAIANLIREGKTYLLPNALRTNGHLSMQTLDKALVNLYLQGKIKWETVLQYCQDTEEVLQLVSNISVISR